MVYLLVVWLSAVYEINKHLLSGDVLTDRPPRWHLIIGISIITPLCPLNKGVAYTLSEGGLLLSVANDKIRRVGCGKH